MVRDEAKDKNLQVEMGWVGQITGGKHENIPKDVGFIIWNLRRIFIITTFNLINIQGEKCILKVNDLAATIQT